jgi:hypothetical protein
MQWQACDATHLQETYVLKMTMKIKEKLETNDGQMEGVRRLFDHAI